MREFDIRQYGAVGDGVTLNTASIQAAIDACVAAGGGRVVFASGTYMTGSIVLGSGVDLHIEQDAVLLGSPRCEDYPEKENLKHVDSYGLPRHRNAALIFAEECQNLSITGMGTIDCNGTSFVEKSEAWKGWNYRRIDAPTPPRVVFFAGCKNIRVEDVTMVNQPSGWSYWIHDCQYVSFDKCKIFAEVQYPNNDGIHINSSTDVTISNCNITCGDDCIIVRANNRSLAEKKVCERVTVTNCNLTSYSAGIRIGWLNDGVIRNCSFSNMVMTNTSVGIAISLPKFKEELPDRGIEDTLVENLTFNNIIMDQIYGRPVKIVVNPVPETRCEAIRNIYFSNIHSRGLEFPHLSGREGCKLRNIRFSDCTFEKLPETALPEYNHHGAACWDRKTEKPVVAHAENVVFHNTEFTC